MGRKLCFGFLLVVDAEDIMPDLDSVKDSSAAVGDVGFLLGYPARLIQEVPTVSTFGTPLWRASTNILLFVGGSAFDQDPGEN
jgi:hypothetical protein